MGRFSGKVMFITGAGDGMGKATAVLAAQDGAKIAIFELFSEKAEETKKIIEANGGECICLIGNILNEEQIKDAVEKTIEKFGKIDFLLNNAGIVHNALLHETSTEDWNKVIGGCLTSVYYTSKYIIPHMIKQGSGAVVNISSASGIRVNPETPAYSPAKAGVIRLTEYMAMTYAEKGIRTNCICPGMIKTGILRNCSKEYLAESEKRIPMKRAAEPEEVARVTCFIFSDEASYMNGSIVNVDGGVTL